MSKKEKFILYDKIVERAKSLNLLNDEKRCHMMDVESADLHFNMRLQEWLDADNFNFAHDFYGIRNNIVRGKFPSTEFGFFVPRFAGRS